MIYKYTPTINKYMYDRYIEYCKMGIKRSNIYRALFPEIFAERGNKKAYNAIDHAIHSFRGRHMYICDEDCFNCCYPDCVRDTSSF